AYRHALPSFPTRRSSDLAESGSGVTVWMGRSRISLRSIRATGSEYAGEMRVVPGELPASSPKRAHPEIGGILEAARYCLPPPGCGVGAIGHAEHEALLARVDWRYLVANPRA